MSDEFALASAWEVVMSRKAVRFVGKQVHSDASASKLSARSVMFAKLMSFCLNLQTKGTQTLSVRKVSVCLRHKASTPGTSVVWMFHKCHHT